MFTNNTFGRNMEDLSEQIKWLG